MYADIQYPVTYIIAILFHLCWSLAVALTTLAALPAAFRMPDAADCDHYVLTCHAAGWARHENAPGGPRDPEHLAAGRGTTESR